jgi:hypothetical protein
MARRTINDDDHRGIPRDANGDPVYVILPPKWRLQYEKDMEHCETAWRATSDPFIAAEALSWAHFHRQAVPAWLHEAMWVVAAGRRSKAHAQRALIAFKHLARYEMVRDLKATGLTWKESYARAADLLAGGSAAGEPKAMKESYGRVRADLKHGRHGLYHTIQAPNSLAAWLEASRPSGKARRTA